MADIIERASAWLDDQRTRHCSRLVVYQRGEQSADVSATIGKTEFEIDSGTGIVETWQSRDFLILADELVLAEAKVLPASGDRIREMQDGMTYIYEVSAPSGQTHWRYSDPYRRTLRIHTKQINIEQP